MSNRTSIVEEENEAHVCEEREPVPFERKGKGKGKGKRFKRRGRESANPTGQYGAIASISLLFS